MKKKYLVATLSLLLLVVVVATGVHVLNREARANQLHRIKVIDDDNGGIGIVGVHCSIWILDHFDGEMEVWDFYDGDTDENGCFDAFDIPNSQATYWVVWVSTVDLLNEGYKPVVGQLTFDSVDYQQDGTYWLCHCELDN